MKQLHLIIITLVCFTLPAKALTGGMADTVRKKASATAVEQAPEYPGGLASFYQYIQQNLTYPDVARLIGIDGKVFISFIIEKDGSVSNVTPAKCIGAGCEAEAVKVIALSKPWKPGIQKGRPVRVQYTLPISFNVTANDGQVQMDTLRQSVYGFIFQIKGKIYTIDEAENLLGKTFPADRIDIATPYDGSGQYAITGKKETYVIVLKS